MLGDLIIRALVIVFGYACPAFECFKAVEKNKADIEQLRFWCKYWIIVALVTIFERIGEIVVSWLPMYGEAKLAFFVYLWYPKTKGTIPVYETFLRPYVAKHDTDMDRKLEEFRARAWDFVILYLKTFATEGQTKFFEILQYLASKSANARNFQVPLTQQQKSPPPAAKTTIYRSTEQQMHVSVHHQPPPPPPPMSMKRAVFQALKKEQVGETPPKVIGEVAVKSNSHDPTSRSYDQPPQHTGMAETLRSARVRLRRAHKPE